VGAARRWRQLRVVTSFTFLLHPVPVPIYAGMVVHPLERAREALWVFLDVAADAPDELGLNAAMVTLPPAPFVPVALRGRRVMVLAAGYVGPLDVGEAAVRALREFAPATMDTFGPMPYAVLQSLVDDAVPAGMPSYARSEWLRPLDETGVDTLVTTAGEMTSPMSQVLLRIMGGAIARVPQGATAFRFREAAAMLTLAGMWPDPTDPGHQHRDWARTAWQQMRPWSAGGGYINHLCDESSDRVREAYGPTTWARLVALKRRLDPDNVFQLNQNIPPSS
jgi:FAD/FMN-containing dehydrogenase